MRYQPNRGYISNDDVQTPPSLARRLVWHFEPAGRILEPCRGDGNFVRALSTFARQRPGDRRRMSDIRLPASAIARPRDAKVHWCEIKRGRDFYAWREPVDWIITNPPWSQIRAFLQHAMCVADNVVFLMTINHVWTKARIRDLTTAGFGLREIILVEMPPTFPQSGFQLGAVHVQRGWTGPIALTDWTGQRRPGGAAPTDDTSEVSPAAADAARQLIPALLRKYRR